MTDGMVLGQVGILLTPACYSDLVVPKVRWPRGMLLGLATAIKPTPAVFLVHLAVTRQWRPLRTAVVTVAAAWSAAFVLLPSDSVKYFLGGVVFLPHGRTAVPAQ